MWWVVAWWVGPHGDLRNGVPCFHLCFGAHRSRLESFIPFPYILPFAVSLVASERLVVGPHLCLSTIVLSICLYPSCLMTDSAHSMPSLLSADMYPYRTHDSRILLPTTHSHSDGPPMPDPIAAAARLSSSTYHHLSSAARSACVLFPPLALTSPDSASSPFSATRALGSSTISTKPKRIRRTPTLDPYTKHIRSVKHNEAEVRRRQRLNGLLVELAECVGCKKPQKSAILRVTLEKVRAMEKKILTLEDKVRHAEQGRQEVDDNCVSENIKRALTIKMTMKPETGSYGLLALSPLSASCTSGSSASFVASMWSSLSGNAWSGNFDDLSGLSASFPSFSSSAASRLDDTSVLSPLPLSLFPPTLTSSSPLCGVPSANDVYKAPVLVSAGCEPSDLLHSAIQNISAKQELADDGVATGASVVLRPGQINVLKAACVPMYVVDLSGRVLDCNSEFESFLGYSLSAIPSSLFTVLKYTHPASSDVSYVHVLEQMAQDNDLMRMEKLYISASGEVKKATTTLFMLRDSDGRQNHVCVVVKPVSNDGWVDGPPALFA